MKQRIAILAGITATMAAFAVGAGAPAAQAGTWDCSKGYRSNFGYANCGSGTGSTFKVGVKCLAPGNVYYWIWSRSYQTGTGAHYVYCNSGHVAKGVDYEITLW
jgi:hypothetical protein